MHAATQQEQLQNKDDMSDKKQECPSCAMMVDADAEVCPICGYDLPKTSKGVIIGVWLLILLMLLWVFL